MGLEFSDVEIFDSKFSELKKKIPGNLDFYFFIFSYIMCIFQGLFISFKLLNLFT